MHRSGTTIVSQIVEKLGCPMGFKKDRNNEDRFLMIISDLLLFANSGAWDSPPKSSIVFVSAKRSQVIYFGSSTIVRTLSLYRR